MVYVVRELQRPNRVVVSGEGDIVSAVDTILFTDGATPGTTHIEYSADIRLKGIYGLFTWLVAGDLHSLAVKAREGLEEAVKEGRYKGASSE